MRPNLPPATRSRRAAPFLPETRLALVKVLCIDGGGIRGLIPALVLAEIERRIGRRIGELVDLVAGTSTGGILACGLTRPGADGRPLYSAQELAGIYVEEGPKIFHRSLLKRIFSVEGWIDERYDDDGLNAALARYLGEERLSGSLADLLVTAYDINGRFAFFFRSARARERSDVRLPARRGRARHRGGAELLRARRGDRCRRRADVPADRRRRVRGESVDVRVRRRRRRRPRGRARADAVARDGRAHPRLHVRADALRGGSSNGRGRCSTWSSTASRTRSSSRPGR